MFVFLDDVQYTKRDWRNRNLFHLNGKDEWLTVPVRSHNRSEKILNIKISSNTEWKKLHLDKFKASYHQTKFFTDAFELFQLIEQDCGDLLSTLNINTTKEVASYLGIETQFQKSSDLDIYGQSASEKLALIVKNLGGEVYVSGPKARDYLELSIFDQLNIKVEFVSHNYAPYERGDFESTTNYSVLDLISYHGSDSYLYL